MSNFLKLLLIPAGSRLSQKSAAGATRQAREASHREGGKISFSFCYICLIMHLKNICGMRQIVACRKRIIAPPGILIPGILSCSHARQSNFNCTQIMHGSFH
ncbi:MAG: hypothetical protein PHG89_05590 [Gallionella sp.]|nr:hypothetical protein [Gallionella sp.]